MTPVAAAGRLEQPRARLRSHMQCSPCSPALQSPCKGTLCMRTRRNTSCCCCQRRGGHAATLHRHRACRRSLACAQGRAHRARRRLAALHLHSSSACACKAAKNCAGHQVSGQTEERFAQPGAVAQGRCTPAQLRVQLKGTLCSDPGAAHLQTQLLPPPVARRVCRHPLLLLLPGARRWRSLCLQSAPQEG